MFKRLFSALILTSVISLPLSAGAMNSLENDPIAGVHWNINVNTGYYPCYYYPYSPYAYPYPPYGYPYSCTPYGYPYPPSPYWAW